VSTQLTQNVAVAGRVTAVLRAVSKRNNDNATSSRDELTALRCRTVAFFPLVSSLVLTQVLTCSQYLNTLQIHQPLQLFIAYDLNTQILAKCFNISEQKNFKN